MMFAASLVKLDMYRALKKNPSCGFQAKAPSQLHCNGCMLNPVQRKRQLQHALLLDIFQRHVCHTLRNMVVMLCKQCIQTGCEPQMLY